MQTQSLFIFEFFFRKSEAKSFCETSRNQEASR